MRTLEDSLKSRWRRVAVYVGLPVAVIGASAVMAHAWDVNWIRPGRPISAESLSANLTELKTGLDGAGGAITENWWEFGLDNDKSGVGIDLHAAAKWPDFAARLYRVAGENGELSLANAGAGPLILYTSLAPRLTVAGNGNVGIGTTNPAGTLDVAGYGGWSSSNMGRQIVVAPGAPNACFPTIGIYDEAGQRPWGISNVSGHLQFSRMPQSVSDNVSARVAKVSFDNDGSTYNATGVWKQLSDATLKTEVRPIEGALARIVQLRGVSFRWKDEQKDRDFGRVEGFLAQDVQRVKPQWVKEGADGLKRLQTIGMDALLVESIKEQQHEIAALRAENKELSTRLAAIETRLSHASGGAAHSRVAATAGGR